MRVALLALVVVKGGLRTMKAVMALLSPGDDVERAVAEMQAEGFSAEQICVLENERAIWERIDCSTRSSEVRDATIGAGLVGLIYAVFGVAAAISGIGNSMPAAWSAGSAVVFLLIGLGLGAFWGAFVGRAEAEKDTHLYLEGVRRGQVLVLVWAGESQGLQAMQILRQTHGLGVRTCERARPAAQPASTSRLRPAH
jgi:hypothetical protein